MKTPPALTRSMQTAMDDLQLAGLWVVYPGKSAYALAKNIQVLPLSETGVTWNYGSTAVQKNKK